MSKKGESGSGKHPMTAPAKRVPARHGALTVREDKGRRKTVRNSQSGIAQLPNDKPVVYKYLTPAGAVNYVGIAKRGRVQERLSEHSRGQPDFVPADKIQIQQHNTIAEARNQEKGIIARSNPKYNKQEPPAVSDTVKPPQSPKGPGKGGRHGTKGSGRS